MRIFKITPIDSKGKRYEDSEWLTQYEDVAMQAFLRGHSVSMTEVKGWRTITFEAVESK